MSDLERLIAQQRSEEAASLQGQKARQDARIAAAAGYARDFIALMRKRNIKPEPVYTVSYIPSRPNAIQRFERVDWGWTLTFYVSEYGSLSSVSYLRADGLVVNCEATRVDQRGPVRGLVPSSTPSAFSRSKEKVYGTWVLTLRRPENQPPQLDPKPPSLDLEGFAAAARRYTG